MVWNFNKHLGIILFRPSSNLLLYQYLCRNGITVKRLAGAMSPP
jgi:hypothetical protein